MLSPGAWILVGSVEQALTRINVRPVRLSNLVIEEDMIMKPEVKAFFHEASNTVSYVVKDPDSDSAAIIDPVLDFDAKSGRTSTTSADQLIGDVEERGLGVAWILETYAHADHLSAAPYIRNKIGGRVGIGEHITEVQALFKKLFNVEKTFNTDGSQFDHLFKDGETFVIGGLEARVMHTPGHTPADVTYVIGEAAFVGDTLFMPDGGTARADFQGGDAHQLYRSIHKVLSLPAETRLFICHDYASGGRDYAWETTVAEERERNIHARDGVSEDEFVVMRTERDKTLEMPTLLIPSVQVNMRAGELPPEEDNGIAYLMLPLNAV